MAIRVFVVPTFLPIAVADNAVFTDGGYLALMGGTSSQSVKIKEVKCDGQEGTTSSPLQLMLARDSTVQATPTALAAPNSDGPVRPNTTALASPVVAFVASTTKPKRSLATTDKLLPFGFNALGGLFRHRWQQGEEPELLGNTASLGEISLSHMSSGTPGNIGAAITYEPF